MQGCLSASPALLPWILAPRCLLTLVLFVPDAFDFCSLARALQYLTFTRTDIAYAVQQVCHHMHDPRGLRLTALKRIICYVCGTLHLGLLLRPSTSGDLTV